jgi:vacuolar-type H+-ATPase subunit H
LDEQERASHTPGGEHELASEVSERIRGIISSAEAAANAVRHEADQRAQVKRRLAEDEARRIVEDARRDAEAYLAERIRRISELSDAVVERGEGIVMRLDRAEEVRRQLQGLADALGDSAEELARELGGSDAPDRRATPEAIRAEQEEAAAATRPEPSTEPEPETSTEASSAESAEIADDPTVGELAEPEAAAEPAVVELVPDEAAERAAREPDDQLSARLVALQMAVAGGKRDEVESHLKRTFDLPDVEGILDDVFGDGAESGKRASWPT